MPEATVITSADDLKSFNTASTSTLVIKSIAIDPATLLTCLSKCSDNLEELRLEKVSLSGPFKKRLTLPQLKTFYLHQVKGGLETKGGLEDFLEGFDCKELLFFDKKAKDDWTLEQIWDLKVNITLVIDGWRILDVNQDELSLTSMLPSSDDIVANSPRELTKLALYDVEITSDSNIPTAELSQLTLYEVIFPDIPAVLKKCSQLEELSMFEEKDEDENDAKKGKQDEELDEDDEDFEDEGEEEEEDGDVDDWNTLELSELPSKSLKKLALGRARLSSKVKGAVTIELDSLALENCKADQESLKLLKAKKVLISSADPQPTATVLKRMTDAASTQSVLIDGFNWEAKDTNKKKMNELLKASSASGELYSGEEKFLLERAAGSKWKGRKFEEEERMEEQFRLFNWNKFCEEDNWKKMFG